jgi:hypothetical protein
MGHTCVIGREGGNALWKKLDGLFGEYFIKIHVSNRNKTFINDSCVYFRG